MNGSRRNRHDYLIIWIDYSVEVEVFISMEYHPKGVIGDFPEYITKEYKMPAASNLFYVRDEDDTKRFLID